MFCPSCGAENLDSAKFCKSCGSLLQDQNQVPQNESQFSVPKGKGNKVVIGIVVVVILLVGGAFLAGQGFFANKNENVSQQQDSQNQSTTNQTQSTTKNNSVANSACGSQVKDNSGITYGTIIAEDGKCWLDRNLGATQVATSATDVASYGWYFQWGRGADGHQIPTSGTTATQVDVPGNNLFITVGSSPYDWRVTPSDALWANSSSTNNPCPTSWHVPLQTEWATLVTSAGLTNSATAYSSTLKLTLAGFRVSSTAGLHDQSSGGGYWSSSPDGSYAYGLLFYSGGVNPASSGDRAYGFSVRCVKD